MVLNLKWDECPFRSSNKGGQGWKNLEIISAKKEKALGQFIPTHSYHRQLHILHHSYYRYFPSKITIGGMG